MKKIIVSVFLLTMVCGINGIAQNKNANAFHYSGSQWEKYNGHRLTIVVLDTSVGGTKTIAEQIIKNGKFDVSGTIQYPQNAFFGLYNPNGDFVYKEEFIVEPGDLVIDHDSVSGDIGITGGKYNPIFIALNNDPEIIARSKSLNDYMATLKQEDFKDDAVRKKYAELNKSVQTYKMDLYNNIRSNNPDPYARLLAMYHSSRKEGYEELLNKLQKELGPIPEIVYLKYSLKAANERRNNSVTIKVGSIIKDFEANNLNGKSLHLSQVLKNNKYTLVEFWASWCGPCRAEIPHMKTAYQKFSKKGFQIVSFTLDHEKNRWEKASTEENLPWINVGDLLAFKSPIVRMFGISGIPANYLVDPSGKIIAMNLRQEKLDDKLAELLGM